MNITNAIKQIVNNWIEDTFDLEPRKSLGSPPHTTTTGTSLVTARGRSYVSGFDDSEIDELAEQHGGKRINDSSIWGKDNADNTDLVIGQIKDASNTNKSLVAHEGHHEVDDLAAKIEDVGPKVNAAENQALEDINRHTIATLEQETKRQEIKQDGYGVPYLKLVVYILGLGALTAGDLLLISLVYQVFGLSDKPMWGFLPVTDLQFAASVSVMGMLLLTHASGTPLRKAFNIYKQTKYQGGSDLSWRLWLSVGMLSDVGALLIATGIALVRSGYMKSQQLDPAFWAFLAIQVGILAAATALAVEYAHPHRRDWRGLCIAMRRTARSQKDSINYFIGLLGTYNGLAERMPRLRAFSFLHVQASSTDASRQAKRYLHGLLMNQPEPTTERLLPKEPMALDVPTEPEINKLLGGLVPVPIYPAKDDARIMAAIAKGQAALLKLQAAAFPELDDSLLTNSSPLPSSSMAGDSSPADAPEASETATFNVTKPSEAAISSNGSGH